VSRSLCRSQPVSGAVGGTGSELCPHLFALSRPGTLAHVAQVVPDGLQGSHSRRSWSAIVTLAVIVNLLADPDAVPGTNRDPSDPAERHRLPHAHLHRPGLSAISMLGLAACCPEGANCPGRQVSAPAAKRGVLIATSPASRSRNAASAAPDRHQRGWPPGLLRRSGPLATALPRSVPATRPAVMTVFAHRATGLRGGSLPLPPASMIFPCRSVSPWWTALTTRPSARSRGGCRTTRR
jgi:hypothetical protein